jgi:hypothetical protein
VYIMFRPWMMLTDVDVDDSSSLKRTGYTTSSRYTTYVLYTVQRYAVLYLACTLSVR